MKRIEEVISRHTYEVPFGNQKRTCTCSLSMLYRLSGYDVIRGSKYDINIVNIAAKEILVQIYKLRYDFDLKKHIELLEDTNSD